MAARNGHLQVLKHNNRAQLVITVRKHGKISRVQLTKATGLSPACVSNLIDELVADEVLIESGTAQGSRGGPSILLEINPNGSPVGGVVIGSEGVIVAIGDQKAQILARRLIPHVMSDDVIDSTVEKIASALSECAEEAGRPLASLAGIGVTVSGLVNTVLGVIHSLTARKGWEDFPIVHALSRKLNVPVFADNDARAVATSSQWLDRESYDGGVLYVFVADGIGAAFVRNQQVLRGAHDAACLVGHITMDPEGPLCQCGKHGCLASLATDKEFIRAIWPDLETGSQDVGGRQRTELVRRGVAMAIAGDATAQRALDSMLTLLGSAIGNMICMLDPANVFVGGTMIDTAPELVMGRLRRVVKENTWSETHGVVLRSVPQMEEYILRGAMGLALAHPYRMLQARQRKELDEQTPSAVLV